LDENKIVGDKLPTFSKKYYKKFISRLNKITHEFSEKNPLFLETSDEAFKIVIEDPEEKIE